VLAPYREILTYRSAWRFSLAGMLARSPMAMVSIGTVLMVQATYGSYGFAGAVAGVFTIAASAMAPVLSMLVDAYGQARVLRPALATNLIGLTALALVGVTHPPHAWVLAAAAVAGAGTGSYGSMVRARWSTLLVDAPGRLHTAYSLESVLDEVVYIAGPAATTVLSVAPHSWGGLALATVLAFAGGTWFLAQRRTEPVPSGRSHQVRSVILDPAMALLALTFIATGSLFGAVDVATVAFSTEHGHRQAAGLVLAAFGIGSMLAGIIYGARSWRASPSGRFAIAATALAIGTVPFLVADSLTWLAITMLIAGAAISPMLISGNAIVVRVVPPAQLTEGLTWVGTALGIGIAIGSAVAGPTIDRYGSHGGFIVTTSAALMVAILAAASVPVTSRRTT
jgi:MFS family permease